MNKMIWTLGSVSLACVTPSAASAATEWGGQTLQTFRDCSAIPLANGCSPLPPRTSVTTGGIGQVVNTSTTRPIGMSSASIDFTGPLSLPTIDATVIAFENGRLGSTIAAVQAYDWTGASGTAFPITGTVTYVVNAANDGTGGFDTKPNVASLNAFQLIMFDPSIISPASLLDGSFAGLNLACGTAGVLGTAYGATNALPGANAARSVSLDLSAACGGGAITLTTGQHFAIEAVLGILGGRGGSITDAHATFDINGSAALKAELKAGLVAASTVPEPSSWAMMLCGFAVAGSALRRRRVVRATFA